MSINKKHNTKVLKFWRAAEIFNLPDVPSLQHPDDPRKFALLMEEDMLPWETGEYLGNNGKRWKHTLYFYCVTKQSVINLMRSLAPLPAKDDPEPLQGDTCMAAMVLDECGQIQERTYVRTSFGYGLKALREKDDLEKINDLLRKANSGFLLRFHILPMEKEEPSDPEAVDDENYENEYEEEEYDNPDDDEDNEASTEKDEEPADTSTLSSVSWTGLMKELEDLQQLMGELLPYKHAILCVSEEVHAQAALDVPFLNSFYTNDLSYLINHPKDIGNPLSVYLSEEVYENTRYDLLSPEVMFSCIDPKYQTAGRWPSNPGHGLHSAQQAALHTTVTSLKGNNGLFGINGPPGTGKTTLLREIIVDVIVERATRMLDTDVTELFSNTRNKLTEYVGYYDPDVDLFKNGILVASNNNGAVENISKELPLLKNIDAETFGEPDYFSDIATALAGNKKCWGLLSAILGNSKNRNFFVNKFWFNDGNGLNDYLKIQFESRSKHEEHKEKYEETAERLKSLLDEYRIFRQRASDYHQLLGERLYGKKFSARKIRELEDLAALLQEEYGITANNLPGEDFFQLSMEAIHKATPYSSPSINTLRSELFLTSLELQYWAIHVNARYFRANLNAFVDMLSGKHAELIDEGIAAILWNTFFFCVPLVSTTLASVEKLFAKLGRERIGWLLLDEAGQATPQSTCGAIWRCQRCIIIGDTLQIPPIVTMPVGLERLLAQQYGLQDICWLPSDHSAQFLADRVTPWGTYVETQNNRVWTGVPLRAHRRCNNPMFAISNAIAYNGQMVKVSQDARTDIPYESCWIHVKGRQPVNGNALQEEIDILQGMIANLLLKGYMQEIYVISPFRTVTKHCSKIFEQRKTIKCGTIHTFQGKESDVVFLVLGTHPKKSGARAWASAMPNMLNVAVTRAKKRLYVIGNKETWGTCNYFDTLAKMLPEANFREGELFLKKNAVR